MSETTTQIPDDNNSELTEIQKQLIKQKWNQTVEQKLPPPNLREWCEFVFGPGVDGRSNSSKKLRIFLSSLDIKPQTLSKYHKKTDDIEITDSIKEFIKNNPNLTSLEIARTVFNDQSLTPLDTKSRAIIEYLRKNQKVLNLPDTGETLEVYKSPRNQIETVARINKFVAHKINIEKLSVQQKKDIEATQAFLQDNRFVFMVNAYTRHELRELFESSFVKYIYNKASDITAEETEQFLNLASSVVTQMQSMEELNALKDQQTIYLQNQQSPPKGLGDRISSLEGNINELVSYQDKVIKTLQGERSKRLENKIAENSSVVALIAAWKQEEHRKRMINYAQLKEKAIKEELNKLTTMAGIKAQLFGIHSSEIVPD